MSNKQIFYKTYFLLAIPLIIQQCFTISLNFVDSIMVGQLGKEYVAGVGFANKLYFIYILTLFGGTSGISIFMSQYFGKKDLNTLRKLFALVLASSLVIGCFFFIIGLFFSNLFIQLFSHDPIVLLIGTNFLGIMALSFPFYAISFSITVSLRSMGIAKEALYITIIITSINILLNYLLIYGHWGLPEMKSTGSATATLIARLIECVSFICLFFNKKYNLRTYIKNYFGLQKELISSIIKVSIPVFFTEIIWVLGTTLLFVAYAQLGTMAGASANIGELIISFGSIIFMGIATGANILVAQTLGSGNKDYAIKISKQIVKIAFVLSTILTLVSLSIIPTILSIYKLTGIYRETTRLVLIAFSCSLFFKMINWTIIIGILRAGGDTKVAFLIDTLPMLIYAVPIAFTASIYLKLDIHIVVLLANVEEVIKILFALYRYKSKKWVKNLTTT